MKKWLILIGIGVVLLLSIGVLYNQLESKKAEITRLTNNSKAHELELEGQILVYEDTIDELSKSNDSLIMHLYDVVKESGIKEKKITQLQYTIDNFKVEKEFIFGDTIFVEKMVEIDTTFKEDWKYSIQLKLNYPNIIKTNIQVESRKSVLFNQKKVTKEAPKKFFLCRWFQKKMIVTEVHIFEENEYITNKDNKFIHINK